ncbi:MAG: hypothetical protein NT027_12350 [Proteobacteria bacterium]|nr:hypothetical protein [Pseudomonadota bacterium]
MKIQSKSSMKLGMFAGLLSAYLIGFSVQGNATADQFLELCKVEVLPSETRATINALKNMVFPFEVHENRSCDEILQKLKLITDVHLPAQTFNYYFTPDLTPISLLDWVESVNINHQIVISLEPLSKLKLKRLSIAGVKSSLSVLSEIPTLEFLSVTIDPSVNRVENLTTLNGLNELYLQIEGGRSNLEALPSTINSLHVSGSGLKSIKGIEQLHSLSHLDLSGVKLSDLNDLKKAVNRQLAVTIQASEINDFSGLGALSLATTLSIQNSNLNNVSFLENMTWLRTLEITGTNIYDINSLAHCTRLVDLNLTRNSIHTADSLNGLSELRNLDLSDNRLLSITLGFWPRLEHLQLYRNRINRGPYLSLLPEQYQITELGLGGNELRVIDPAIGKMDNLEVLDLSENKIFKVEPIADLPRLRELYLRDNKIVDMTPLAKLSGLTKLTVRDNPTPNAECPVQPATTCL